LEKYKISFNLFKMKKIKKIKKTFIIAEIGNNHEGNYKIAKKLVKLAAKAGVDAVKFQTFKVDDFINQKDKKDIIKLKGFN
jgi:N,N'-diacetyllegionaminate synthase